MKRALFRSLIAMGAMAAFYVVVLSLLGGGIDFPIQQFQTFWMYLVPLVLSYGSLVFVSTTAKQREMMIVGTPTSAASMVACCAHHVADLVSLSSVFSATAFLVQYQTWLMVGAIGVNAALTVWIAVRLKRPGPGVRQGQAL